MPNKSQTAVQDRLLTANKSAALLGIHRASFYRGVAAGWLPVPVYPSPRAPRWWKSRLLEAVNNTAATPAKAKTARRKAKLAKIRRAKQTARRKAKLADTAQAAATA